MALCSDAELDETGSAIGEPTECALVNYAAVNGLKKPALKAEQPRVGEAPFDSMRKMMSTLHRLPDGSGIAATASDTATMKESSTGSCRRTPTALSPSA